MAAASVEKPLLGLARAGLLYFDETRGGHEVLAIAAGEVDFLYFAHLVFLLRYFFLSVRVATLGEWFWVAV